MSSSHSPARWDLDDRALQGLLARLDTDPAAAGEKYEQLHRGLVKIFERRGAPAPDMCADETIDRVARKLDSGATIDNVVAFAYGVARLIWLEQRRRPESREIGLDTAIDRPAATVGRDADDPRLACLERCLGELDADARHLILKYYVDARRNRISARAALATELGLTQNALRSRAQRIRDRLERCTNACADQRSNVAQDFRPAGEEEP
jgi:DNA-directed RNA polymerase specialized sigma24 family protein